jgi:hypothetical protein
MDVNVSLSSGPASVKMPPAQVIVDLDSDSESSIKDALVAQRVGISGVNGNDLEVEGSGDDEEEDDWDEVESMLEETLEEIGDEVLHNAGKSLETRMSTTR